jgi:hypothetical protein
MAKVIFTNGQILVNGVDLSDHAAEITIDTKAADIDVTAMGATGKQRMPGLKDESIKVKWRQDFAASKVDASLQPLYAAGTEFVIEVRPVNGARSTTNPGYNGNAYLLEYQPIAGAVGSAMDIQTSFVVDGALTRSTS